MTLDLFTSQFFHVILTYRFAVHPDVRFCLESVSDNTDFMPAFVYIEMSSQEIFPTKLFQVNLVKPYDSRALVCLASYSFPRCFP